MELLQLEYFLRVARSGNVSQTAAEINVAQSSVSRSIARLEESLGFPLFERVGRKIVLNEYAAVKAQNGIHSAERRSRRPSARWWR